MATRSIALAEPQTLAEMRDLAALADLCGYHGVWLAETRGPDVMVTAGVIGAATTSVVLGSLIAPVYTRTPAVLAMAASTVADVSGRRFRLGLGTGGQAMIERWHGQDFRRPVARVEQTVQILRAALRGEKTDASLEEVSSQGFRLSRDGDEPVEIHLAALGDRMLEMAAAVADGILLTWLPAGDVAQVVARVRQAADRAGRDPASVRVACRVLAAVTDDVGAATARLPETLTPYLTSPPYNRFFAEHGFAPEAAAFTEAFSRRDRAGALAAVTPSMAAALVVAGDGDTCEKQLAAFVEAGADEVIVAPFAQLGPDVVRATVEALAPGGADGRR